MRFLALTYAEILVGTYYRRHRFGQSVPESGGLVIYTNHTNGLVDGDLPLFLTKRQQFILAKASLFKIPVLNWLIRQVGAIPIYRQKDQVDMSLNEESFREVHERLREGQALVIYPEGESRLGWQLRPFRTGAARMVLEAETAGPLEEPIQLLPVCFLYEEPETLQSRVHLWVGEAFDARGLLEDYEGDRRETVRQLTRVMRKRLDRQVIPIDSREQLNTLVGLDRILHSEAQGCPQRLQSLAEPWALWQQDNPSETSEFQARLGQFSRRMRRLGLEGYDIASTHLIRQGSQRSIAALTLLVGIVLWVFWAPPLILSRVIARLGRSTPDKLVTVTVIANSAFVPLWVLGLSVWGFGRLAFWPCLGILIAWSLFSLWVVRRAGRPRPLRRALTYLGLQGSEQTVDQLWIEKQNLIQEWRKGTRKPDHPKGDS